MINDSILNLSPKDKYDIVHCSHVIEHFGYPEVTKVLDFLVDSVKQEGRLIVRSPLMWKDFYLDIDHVRPYSPRTIALYFNCKQQQKQGIGNIEFDCVWYRTMPRQLDSISQKHLVYGVPFLRKPLNWFIRRLNKRYQKWWNKYRWPATDPNGYVAIIKYVSNNE